MKVSYNSLNKKFFPEIPKQKTVQTVFNEANKEGSINYTVKISNIK